MSRTTKNTDRITDSHTGQSHHLAGLFGQKCIRLVDHCGVNAAVVGRGERRANFFHGNDFRSQLFPRADPLEILACINAGRDRARIAERNPLDAEQVTQRFAAHDHQLVRQEHLPIGDQIADLVHRFLVGGKKDIDWRAGSDLQSEDVGACKSERYALMPSPITTNPDTSLSATQFGVTIFALPLGWIGQPAFTKHIEPRISFFGSWTPGIAHSIAASLAFIAISWLHITSGELAPKYI